MNKILIVSDNYKITTSLVRLLRAEYDIVTIGNNIPSVLELAEDSCPDNIIIEGKGYAEVRDVLFKLRQKFPLSNILFISSFLSSEDREDIKAGGRVDSILVKPCNKTSIFKALKKKRSNVNRIDSRLIHPIIEAYGAKNAVLSKCYGRISNLMSMLYSYMDFDFKYVHDLFVYYLSVITTLEEDVITDLLSGVHTRSDAIPLLIDQLESIKESVNAQMSDFETSPIYDMIYINKKYNGSGLPDDGVAGEDLPQAARILRVLFDFYYLEESGKSYGESMYILSSRTGWYEDSILIALSEALGDDARYYDREVFPLGLQVDMQMAQDMYVTVNGKKILLIKAGQMLTEHNIDYITSHAQDILDITEPILIRESVLICEGRNA